MPVYPLLACIAAGVLAGMAISRWKLPRFLILVLMLGVFLLSFKLFGFKPLGLLASPGGYLILMVSGLIFLLAACRFQTRN